jgi:membrane associated rhomboid family serine protease
MTNQDDDRKIKRFPDEHERAALEKARLVHQKVPDEPIFNIPPIVQALCLVNVAIFVFGYFFPQLMTDDLIYKLAFVPARYVNGAPLDFSAFFSPFTHMFLHGSWMHISLNVGMLLAFGAGLEKVIGGRRLLVLYFAAGLCGALLHLIIYPHDESPMIGASGAISGLFGGVMIMLYAQGLMGKGYARLLPVVLIWIGVSVFFGYFGMPGVDNPIAWTAHVGGFLGGLALYGPVSRLKIRH